MWVDAEAPQRDALEEAARWIARGRVIAIPTDTLYGLAADPFQPDAVRRVFAIKERPPDQPVPLIAADADGRRAGVLIVLPLGLCFLPAFVLAGLVPVIVAVLGGVLHP